MSVASRVIAAVTVVAVSLAALGAGSAAASPPVPLFTKLSDLARVQTVDAGFLSTPPGTDSLVSMYTLPLGTASAWTSPRGTSVLGVTRGVLTVRAAKGSAVKEYRAGEAAVLPPGRYRVENSGAAAAEFAGIFANLGRTAEQPLGAGSAAVGENVRGTMVPLTAYGNSLHAKHADGFAIEPGTDLLVGSYTLLPGFSSGWATHTPAVGLIRSGTLTYYEASDEGCARSEVYTAGQAYTHVGGLHMGVNESDEPLEAIIVWFNLDHDSPRRFIPGVGNTTDAIDFTPLPPAECPRLS